MSDNWVVQNLENALETWNEKLSEIWTLITTTPQNFKGGNIWKVIVDINGAVQAIGLGIMLLPTDIHQRKKRGEAMTENKIIIPIWKKSNLTVEEAAAYCGIGSRKLREMSDSEFCPFVLWNGSKRLIKRRKLDEYLDNAYSI